MTNEPLMRRVGEIYIANNAVVVGDVILGPGVNLWFGVVIRGDIGRVTLGPRVNLQDGVIVHTDYDGANDVEEGVVAGHGAILHGRRVGRGCLIGMGATVLSRSELGPECIVAAGCVVPEGMIVPPRSLVVGVPGKVIKSVTEEQIAEIRRINAHYLENAGRFARGEFRVVSGEGT